MAEQTNTLTAKQRKTLKDAEQILVGLIVGKEEVLMLSLHGKWESFSTTYFSPEGVQHSSLWATGGNTFADKIDRMLAIRDDEAGRADQIKADKLERLRAELAALTAESA